MGIAAAAAVLVGVGVHTASPTTRDRLLASFEGDYLPLSESGFSPAHGPIPISPYDEVFRQEGARSGYDWRLLAAIASQESRFNRTAVSPRGAQGLMQIMPATARRMGVSEDRITDPRTNIRMGTTLLSGNRRSMRFPAAMSADDQLSILLASYNAGIGHVLDARRLAVEFGDDPNKWDDVAMWLTWLADEDIYSDEVVRAGAFNGSQETIEFVEAVMRKYERYKNRYE